MRKIIAFTTMLFVLAGSGWVAAQDSGESEEKLWVEYNPPQGKAVGKHIVLIAGDDEYRSEEALPMLGAILAKHHGFKCTVLFPIDPKTNFIKPDYQENIPGMKAIDDADLIIMGLRFRNLPDKDMKHLDDFLKAGKPIIGLRTSTHAFRIKSRDSKYRHYDFRFGSEWKGGFGQQVLGDTWINHHGSHKRESTRGVVEKANAGHIVLKGVDDVWGDTDVYGIRNLTKDATILLRGQVLAGMKPTDPPVKGRKNDPMMPLAWFKPYQMKGGKKGTAFCTTMGSSTDFANADLRLLIVNASYYLLGMKDKIDGKGNVEYVTKYKPTMYGFRTYQKGRKPSEFQLDFSKK